MQDYLATVVLSDGTNENAWGKYMTGSLWRIDLQHLWGLYERTGSDTQRQIRMLTAITKVMREGMLDKGVQMNNLIIKTAFSELTMDSIMAQLTKGENNNISVYDRMYETYLIFAFGKTA